MEGVKEELLDSIRPEERNYEREIRETYKHCPQLFVTHSSDLLNITLHTRNAPASSPYLVARSTFSKYDVLLEVRGSIISYPRLLRLVQEGKVERAKLPTLLYLNFEQQLLLSPKNIAKYLFTAPHPSPSSPSPNCYIENHFGSKLLVTASRDIAVGEEIILERDSLSRTIYSFNPLEF
jgi:hypothetical protein